MPRRAKTEVSAVNIRIQADHTRNYTALLESLARLKVGVKVFGDTYVAISSFDGSTGEGILSKYTEIDIDGDWFDIEDFDVATPDKIQDVSIPDNLRPNYAAFYFKVDPDLHVLAFETYSDSKGLSSRSVERYFREILSRSEIVENFGRIEADVVKNYSEIEKILHLPYLRELRLIIRRPNPDDVSGDLAAKIEERLREQNGEEYEEALKSKDEDGLRPNSRTKRLSLVAAENGQVAAKSIVNGVLVSHDTTEKPLKEVETFSRDETEAKFVFLTLADRIYNQIRRSRDRVSSG